MCLCLRACLCVRVTLCFATPCFPHLSHNPMLQKEIMRIFAHCLQEEKYVLSRRPNQWREASSLWTSDQTSYPQDGICIRRSVCPSVLLSILQPFRPTTSVMRRDRKRFLSLMVDASICHVFLFSSSFFLHFLLSQSYLICLPPPLVSITVLSRLIFLGFLSFFKTSPSS